MITDCDVDDLEAGGGFDDAVADAVADADDEDCDCLDISVNNKTQILPAS